MTQAQDAGLPFEDFVQALQSQLDRVQASMALKAQAGLPLTFAVKDLSLDLRAHVEMVDSVIRLRPAAPGETDTSLVHITLTTITRPMIEENARSFASSADPPLREALGASMSEAEQRRLEWIGVHSLSQLRALHERTGEAVIGGVAGIPVNRLRLALQRAAQPSISHVEPLPGGDLGGGDHLDTGDIGGDGGGGLVAIHGSNLVGHGLPVVHIDDQPLPVVDAQPSRLTVAVPPGPLQGQLHLQTGPDLVATHMVNPMLVGRLAAHVGMPG
jgi:hypothetical protein